MRYSTYLSQAFSNSRVGKSKSFIELMVQIPRNIQTVYTFY